MSILDPNLNKGANLSKPNLSSKNIVESAADLSGLNNKLSNLEDQLADKLTAPAQETIDKAKKATETAKEIAHQAQEIKKIIPGDLTSLPNGLITPEQFAEFKGVNSLIATYGGDPETNLANSHIVYSKITIGGERVLADSHFVVEIEQKATEHDTFTIKCSAEAIDGPNAYPLEKARSFLGKRTTIQFIQYGAPAQVYTGIITHIKNKRENGESQLILTGKSPTILLENGLDSQSFENADLENIIRKATAEYPQDLVQWKIQPLQKEKIPYTVQYRESDWNFIKRLATRYGEWLYYDGQQIVFGPYAGKTWELVEEQDVYDCSLKMELVPQKFNYISYDPKQAQAHNVDSESVSLSRRLVNPFQQYAIQASETIYSKVPTSLYNHSLMEGGEYELKQAVKRQKQKRQNVFFMEAKTNNPNLKVGDNVKLKAWMPGHPIFKNGEVPLETYRIIEIYHFQDVTEAYYNQIVAIPKDNEVPPYMDEDAFPECEEHSATVIDNNDPEGMSRIRVQFPWQKAFGGQSPWIRSITPYAGEGKGMHVIPEIGEEVIVSFENGNAEKPVSLGAMFNGKGKSGHGGAGNFIKGLQTASGNKLLMNDQAGSVLLEDHGQTSMNFDGAGNSSLGTSASHTITVGATKESPDGQAKFSMTNTGEITLNGTKSLKINVGASTFEMFSDGTIHINGNKITATGVETKVIGSELTEVGKPGADPGIKIDKNVNIQGEEVDIN
ncbi:Rhs element Vgr protein [Apibacter muscae]|uniref:type VI secretion system Vgr family protein n=1 Tax=Apibacter muscae TaxID=2509004 RepID=UPI0011ACC29D|nr:phage baseplate assembly protein V [Apibacter muscae]TWP24682.1 Rhs element Vgr protein [Apibacter muscae]